MLRYFYEVTNWTRNLYSKVKFWFKYISNIIYSIVIDIITEINIFINSLQQNVLISNSFFTTSEYNLSTLKQ